MDYLGILKESWAVTWRNKKLWILGLLGGSTAGFSSMSPGSSSSSGPRGNVNYQPSGEQEVQRAIDWMHQYHALPAWVDTVPDFVGFILLVVAVLFVIALVFWLIGIAARGGLVHLSREALEGREVSLNDGWRVGFRYWGRVFLVRFLVGLPMIVLAMAAAAITAVAVVPLIATGGDPTTVPMLGLLVILIPIAIVMALGSVVIHMLGEIGVRSAVLADTTATESIAIAWRSLWGRRGVFTTWVMTLLTSWGVGIAAIVALVPFGLVLVGGVIAQSAAIVIFAVLLLLFEIFTVCAISGTLLSTVWTTFYVRYLAEEPNA